MIKSKMILKLRKHTSSSILSICITLILNITEVSCYKEPPIEFIRRPTGFTLSIPNDPEIERVLFLIEINEQCPAYMDSLLKPKYIEGRDRGALLLRWITEQNDRQLQDGDTLGIVILIQHQGGISKIQANHKVTPGLQQTILSDLESRDFGSEDHCEMSKPNSTCQRSRTRVKTNSAEEICSGKLLFYQEFTAQNTIDEHYWSYDVKNRLDGDGDEEFVFFNRSNVFLKNGTLLIVPTLNPTIRRGRLAVPGCRWANCTIEANPQKKQILPPIISGRISTKESLKFKYGKIRIRAKLPVGDWIFPHISLRTESDLEPVIALAFTRGNEDLIDTTNGQDIGGRQLSYGVIRWRFAKNRAGRTFRWPSLVMKSKSHVEHYGNDFHEYVLTWTEDSISLRVDEETLEEIPEKLDRECFLELGVSAGSHWVFPEKAISSRFRNMTKPWKNLSPTAAFDYWRGRAMWMHDGVWDETNLRHALQITHIEIYAL